MALYAAMFFGYLTLDFVKAPVWIFAAALMTGVIGGIVQPLLESVPCGSRSASGSTMDTFGRRVRRRSWR